MNREADAISQNYPCNTLYRFWFKFLLMEMALCQKKKKNLLSIIISFLFDSWYL